MKRNDDSYSVMLEDSPHPEVQFWTSGTAGGILAVAATLVVIVIVTLVAS